MRSSKFAIVTGASSGIGLEIAKLAAADGYDLLLAADTPFVDTATGLKDLGVEVTQVECDLSTRQGVDQLLDAAGGRDIDVLVANAGSGTGGAFLDVDPRDWRHSLDTNVTGTLLLIQPVLRAMVARGEGRVLITGSIAGYVPGPFNAVYNASKAFIDSFAAAIANEVKDSGVTVTCLKPGATETEFFARADMEDTALGQMKKADPADVARTGWEAMLKGKPSIVHGALNQAQVLGASVLPEAVTAQAHRKLAEPREDTD
ncbi:MAG: SDR family NAD(P)-dependent oxidoreductase [Pseudomonadota bacterium]|nr:SDR family NAD(P)-dependent oxidoreductase [Pseudomonadota bacterium]